MCVHVCVRVCVRACVCNEPTGYGLLSVYIINSLSMCVNTQLMRNEGHTRIKEDHMPPFCIETLAI